MTFDVEIEGLAELQAEWSATCDVLEQDLNDDAVKAADVGIKEAQDNHPYTDRTYQLTETAHVELEAFGEAAMIWPKEYAGYVDEGTGRSAPHPFTPQAEARADASLEHSAEQSVDKACARMNR